MQVIIERIKQGANNKTFKNGIWLYMLQFFNTIIPMITIPYITRILGPSRFGTFSISINIIGYLQVITEYGFGMSATREVAVASEQKEVIKRLFPCIVCSRIALLSIGVFVSILYALFAGFTLVEFQSLLILYFMLLGVVFQLNWAFQGAQDMKYIAIITIIGRLISTVLIFCLIHTSDDLLLYCFLYSTSPVICSSLGLYIAHKKYGIKFSIPHRDDIIQEIKKGWYVFTTSLSAKVFSAIGVTFLGIFSSDYEVGIFSAIQKIPNLIIMIWSPISQVIYPISSEKFHKSLDCGRSFVSKTRKVLFPIFIVIVTVLGIIAKEIVSLVFGDEYLNDYFWIYPLLAWVIVSIWNNFSGVQTLLASGHDKEYSFCFNISVVCTIILNYLLTRLYGGLGASFAPLISEAVLGILIIIAVHKIQCKQASFKLTWRK